MSAASLHFLPTSRAAAEELSARLGIRAHEIIIHRFPDGESRVRIHPVKGTAILFASLNNPNEKLLHLAFAAATLRNDGATRLILVAPYLCYMRQDMAFETGDAVSQRIIGDYLSRYFDRVITVDPHLHRIDNLQSIFSNCQADALTASGLIANSLLAKVDRSLLLVGPDAESLQWVGAIAEKLDAPFIVATKVRHDDRNVEVRFADEKKIMGANAVILDDVISSGMTVCRAAEALLKAGAKTVEVIAVHALCSDADLIAIQTAGVLSIRSTDSVPHSTNAISLAQLLCRALTKET
ncbi:ribose-phosphate diphosphokinase [Sneathiella sp. HT1-7]|uniref:ribose-phosphate diphosphokinase n=1 Tax=Sneathiella sp. HT1-7 TaxID=2887192 RepID=UPI001D13D0B1|nr:ribose-phosphate diphosphokinase [Sneathiella sp. HT1-7]MCC3305111.1 ribose-phosphate diphosphokinase [Sneathiella sp. HT1-7]